MPSAIAASLPGVSLYGFKDTDQPHFGVFGLCGFSYSYGVFSCISFTLVTSIMCGFSCISFTLVISIICGFRYISFTLVISLGVLGCISFGYQPVRLSLYQRRFRLSACAAELVSFTFGYTAVWLQVHQLVVVTLCGYSYISFTFSYQPMWLQLYQVHF